MSKNIWLLTEERPKRNVVYIILARFCSGSGFSHSTEDIRIVPIMKNGKFQFCYRVIGFQSPEIKEIFILPVSGHSSFVDFMLFYQGSRPSDKDQPQLLIEETKTDDTESRNTGVYQRCTKFVVTNYFYPGVQSIMFYNLQIPQKTKPTATDIFGTRMLLTYGVEILGKKHDPVIFKPFESLDELIAAKNSMGLPGNGVPVRIKREDDAIKISAKLEKGGRLAHDPNIGMLSIMCACIRMLGWERRIIITDHALPGSGSVGNKNKFNYVAREYGIELEGIKLPVVEWPDEYWQHEKIKEKTGTIFVHVIVENFTSAFAIYENHGGCERGYFLDYSKKQLEIMTVQKYSDRDKYKGGDKRSIIFIPDLVLWDKKNNEIIDIEGKTFLNRAQGVVELKNLDSFEELIVSSRYSDQKIIRSLVLAGKGSPRQASQLKELGLYLDSSGIITLGQNSPKIIKEAVAKLGTS